jgi:cysteine desulfurase
VSAVPAVKTVYLDNAATTRAAPEAAAAAARAMLEDFGNPSSAHAPGRRAAEMLEARARTSRVF